MELGATRDGGESAGILKKDGSAWILPEDLGTDSAAGLHAALMGLRGEACELNASEVRRLGGLSLQVLMAAAATWSADGQPLRFVDPSPAFQDALRQLGAAGTFPNA